jgi:uncharacterized protein YqfA (UPF0365 family)
VGTTAAFEILSIDLEKKRIGLALVEEGSARAADPARAQAKLSGREADEVREDTEHADVAAPEGFGSFAEKLRALKTPER